MLTPEQEKIRMQGIGGTDVAAIMGFSDWRTPYDVWMEKTGRVKFEYTREEKPWLWWGKRLEDTIAEVFAEDMKVELYNPGTIIHPKHKWMLGHPDRLIIGTGIPVDCKIARESTANKDWGERKDDVKLPYIFQLQDYMALTDTLKAYIAVLIGNSDFRIYTIHRDDELIDMIIRDCERFYVEHILTDIPPQPINRADVITRWPTDTGTYREATSEEILNCQEYNLLKEDYNKIDKKIKEIKSKMVISIKKLSGLTYEGRKIATHHKNKSGSRTLLIKKERKS